MLSGNKISTRSLITTVTWKKSKSWPSSDIYRNSDGHVQDMYGRMRPTLEETLQHGSAFKFQELDTFMYQSIIFLQKPVFYGLTGLHHWFSLISGTSVSDDRDRDNAPSSTHVETVDRGVGPTPAPPLPPLPDPRLHHYLGLSPHFADPRNGLPDLGKKYSQIS